MADRQTTVSEADIRRVLTAVIDPDLGDNIVNLGFVKNVAIDGGDVRFDVQLTTPACPVKEDFKRQCTELVEGLAGVDKATVTMTADTVGARRAPDKGDVLPGVKNVVAVASGKGGVGKSTVASNLALALAATGSRVGLMDADIYGPSVPTMFNVTEKAMVAADRRIMPILSYGMKFMSVGFLGQGDGPMILRGPMVHGIIQQFLTVVDWGELDYLVVDMPPGTGDAQLTLTQMAPLSGAVIVTTPQEVSLIDARKGLRMFETVNVPVLGIIENMSYFVCPKCDEPTEIFKSGGGERTAAELNVPFLGKVPLDPAVVVGGDDGVPVVHSRPESTAAKAFIGIAGKVAARLSTLQLESKEGDRGPGRPRDIRRDDDSLIIEWDDGSENRYPFLELRLQCPCAQCVDEWTGEPKLDPSTIPADVHPVTIEDVGLYAIRVNWSDGHSTGIYTFERLRGAPAG